MINDVYEVLESDVVENDFDTPSNSFAFTNISPSQIDMLFEILARVLGFGAILGTLAFAAWGIVHTAF